MTCFVVRCTIIRGRMAGHGAVYYVHSEPEIDSAFLPSLRKQFPEFVIVAMSNVVVFWQNLKTVEELGFLCGLFDSS